MFIDLDDFKGVNDTLGHAIGDELLRGVASRLVRRVRKDDVVARLGGDEFAVLVQRDERRRAGRRRARRAHAPVLPLPVAAGEKPLNVSLSIGIAAEPAAPARRRRAPARRRRRHVRGQGGRQAPLRRLHARDARLDRPPPRLQGRARARASSSATSSSSTSRSSTSTTGEAVSVEALVRWNHPGRGRIPPAEFIPLAEDTGLIVPLGRYVLEEACTRVAERIRTCACRSTCPRSSSSTRT